MYIDHQTIIIVLIAVTASLLLFSISFAYMIHLFRNRKNNEYSVENMRLIKWQTEMLSEYERYLNEISLQLHNKVQQQALHIKHVLWLAERRWRRGEPINLDEVNGLIEQLCSDTGHLMQSMNLEYLRSQSLATLIENELETATNDNDIVYEMAADPSEPKLSEEVKIILYRIVQEAVTNISKHAMATFAGISMLYTNNKFTISIEDDGRGLSPEKIYGSVTHGFVNMRNRAAMINARLDIKSVNSSGTKIIIEMQM